jgi:methionine-rich copper-binding protein CopC
LRGGTRAEVLNQSITEERIIAYLLGDLPLEEAERFEDECFAGEDWPGQLHLAEEDLIDEYLRGTLAPERRRRFEENYLTTDARVERVRMAAALLRHVDSHAPTRTEANVSGVQSAAAAEATLAAQPQERHKRESWFDALWGGRTVVPRAAMSFALLLIVVAGAFVIYSRIAPRNHPTIVMVALTPTNAERGTGAEPTKVKLPKDAGALRVSLAPPEGSTPSARYRVELDDGEGKTESLEATGEDAHSVSVVIPAVHLSRGTYALRLFAVNAEGVEQRIRGSYLFSVE